MLSISVVVVSYNSEKFLEDNLKSLVFQTYKFKQILVVDNCSSDRSSEIIGKFGEVELLQPKKNIGYPAALNLGIEKCNADIILVANSDIILEEDFNRKIVEKFASEEDVDIISPLMLRFGGEIVDSAGQTYSRALYPVEIGFGKSISDVKFKETDLFSVCGAATVFRKQSLERLKVDGEYYDESFFLFWEDFDIGWRASQLGMKIILLPSVKIFHFRGGTLEQSLVSRFSMALARSSEIKFHLVKNRLLTLIKNFRLKDFWYNIPFIVIKDLFWIGMLTLSSPKIIIKILGSGKVFRTAFKRRKVIKRNE